MAWRRALAAGMVAGLAMGSGAVTAQPDPNKTLRVAFLIAETGFDGMRSMFDPLFRFDYLARPHKIIPNTAAAMPEMADGGKTWTIRVKPGTYFADDPAFKGARRELTAAWMSSTSYCVSAGSLEDLRTRRLMRARSSMPVRS